VDTDSKTPETPTALSRVPAADLDRSASIAGRAGRSNRRTPLHRRGGVVRNEGRGMRVANESKGRWSARLARDGFARMARMASESLRTSIFTAGFAQTGGRCSRFGGPAKTGRAPRNRSEFSIWRHIAPALPRAASGGARPLNDPDLNGGDADWLPSPGRATGCPQSNRTFAAPSSRTRLQARLTHP